MKLPNQAHVAIVDGEHFIMMRNEGQLFEPKLTKIDQPELESTNFSAGVRHQDDAGQRTSSTDLNELAHGAAAAQWLNTRAISGEITDLLVIADPKTLGEMRRHYHGELSKRIVGEIAKTLTSEAADQIEKAIIAA
ncbi:MAG: host attachment protein [Pontixanthobacter sp.]